MAIEQIVARTRAHERRGAARGRLALVLLLAATLLLVGCGTESSPETTETAEAATETTEAAVSTDTTAATPTSVAGPSTSVGGPLVELPQAVEATRQQLLALAQEKDYAGLAQVAAEGQADFNYSFGEPAGGDPTEYWQRLEESGDSPAEELERILRLPYAEQQGNFIWPFAHTLVPPFDQEERQRLEEHFSAEQIAEWEQFGAYSGYRTAISSEGEWLYFVAGD